MRMSCTLKFATKSAAPVRNDQVGSDFCERRAGQRAWRDLWRVWERASDLLRPKEASRQVVEHGYEGYIAKDEASPYVAGPTRRWLKVKQKGWTHRRCGDLDSAAEGDRVWMTCARGARIECDGGRD